MIPKRLEDITAEDLEALVENGVSEGRSLEFKGKLPGGSDGDKKKFLAAVSSLANSGGGDLVFGVSEKLDHEGTQTGVPGTIEGLENAQNEDALGLRLDNMVRDGIEPRVAIRLKFVRGFSAGPVLVLRVSPSWAAPHMVTLGGSSRFHARGARGKYQMDVQQIREAFLRSERLEQSIREFRDRRLEIIAAGRGLRVFPLGPKLVVHSSPLRAVGLNANLLFDLGKLRAATGELRKTFTELGADDFSGRPNLDGWQIPGRGLGKLSLQLFRDGRLEFVDPTIAQKSEGHLSLSAEDLGRTIVAVGEAFVSTHRILDLVPPCILMVSLQDVARCHLLDQEQQRKSELRLGRKPAFDHDIGPLPEVLIEDFETDLPSLVRPILDVISQAAGYDRSPLYDQEGTWKG